DAQALVGELAAEGGGRSLGRLRRPRRARLAVRARRPRASAPPARTGLLPDGHSARAPTRPRSGPPRASVQGHGDPLMRTVFINGRVLTDSGLEEGLSVVVEGERIAEVAPRRHVRLGGADVVDL